MVFSNRSDSLKRNIVDQPLLKTASEFPHSTSLGSGIQLS